MDRLQKKGSVKELRRAFAEHELVLVAHYPGLSVAQMSDLRNKMRPSGTTVKVAKNRLAMIAAKGTAYEQLGDLMKGPTVLAFAKDPVAAAKVANDFAKINNKLVVLGAVMGDKLLTVKNVEALSKLPSLNELRAKIAGLVAAPAVKIVTVLEAPAAQVARVLSAYAQKEQA